MPRLVPTGHGPEVVEISPKKCPNGHPLRPGNLTAGYLTCGCVPSGGHCTYRCWTCHAVIYDPPHDGRPVDHGGR